MSISQCNAAHKAQPFCLAPSWQSVLLSFPFLPHPPLHSCRRKAVSLSSQQPSSPLPAAFPYIKRERPVRVLTWDFCSVWSLKGFVDVGQLRKEMLRKKRCVHAQLW